MIDTQLPCALFVSDFADPEVLTAEILKDDSFPKFNYLEGDFKAFPWSIDTKYYKTTIHLCPVKNDAILPDSILSLTEAIVLYFDCKNVESFNNIKKWTDSIKDEPPEILLLICDTFKDIPAGGVSRTSAKMWCLENGFELIELENSEIDNDNSDYNIIPDKKGIERIIEALHTHMWPNLDMKSSQSIGMQGSSQRTDEDDFDDTNMDNFCDLFSQLNSMQESISSLPLRDRRLYAEQVVSTFWKAIGGDNDEIDDVSE